MGFAIFLTVLVAIVFAYLHYKKNQTVLDLEAKVAELQQVVEGWFKKKGEPIHFGSDNGVHVDDTSVQGTVDAKQYSVNGVPGWSGTFTTVDVHAITVTNGIVTEVTEKPE
jgi:hypothetical protein